MIVVWGIDGDGPTDAVRAALSAIDTPSKFLNQRDRETTCVDFDIDPHGQPVGTITVNGQRLSVDDVEAMYVRPYNTEQVVGPIDQQAVADAIATDMSLSALADLCQGFVVNRPFRMASNNSKPYQMEVIRAHGFDVPETLITTDADAAFTFVERYGRVIYKSISGVRSVVQSLGVDDRARLVDVAHSPTQFQEQVDGTDVRVHVVGDRCFATAIESGADDYRYASRQQHDATLSETILPGDVADRCVGLSRSLGLEVSGIDLRHSPDDRWFCFEANPSPAFTYYEQATGQPLAEAIAELLVR